MDESKKVDMHWLEKMPTADQQILKFRNLMNSMKGKPWHLSIDLDGFPLDLASGVSAPGVFGISPSIFLELDPMKSWSTLQSIGIYELNPRFDINQQTSRLASKLAYLLLSYV